MAVFLLEMGQNEWMNLQSTVYNVVPGKLFLTAEFFS